MATEKRLVDADTIARKLKTAYCAECNIVRKIQCSACWVDDVLELLEGETVDAMEVVHGRWINQRSIFSGMFQIKGQDCSECGYTIGENPLNYCPNCGAKMDGDGNG